MKYILKARPFGFHFLIPAWMLAVSLVSLSAAQHETALDAYVRAPDSHYSYQLIDKVSQDHCTAFLLEMTSQQWRKPTEVDRPIWKHWLTIYKPDNVKSSTGLLFITGGSTTDRHPKPDASMTSVATTTGTVVAQLRDIPNEPLTFMGDSYGPRKEDQIIAYSWRQFLNTGDDTWPLRLPMTKAAVRAMDATTAFAATPEGGSVRVDHFVVTGASKRGWTTWTTAAVDKRVVAIVPMVIDVLNVIPSFEHHYRSYGFWATSVKDYFDMELMDEMNSSGYRKLMQIEDPYSYRDRLTMPKLLINAAGDQFFLPDSSQFYFDQLPGENHLLYEANTDHSLKGTDVLESLTAFYQSIVTGETRPEVHYKLEHDGSLHVTTKETPSQVELWQATNADHRDFRLESIGPAYRGSVLSATAPGVYDAHVARPTKGWTAFFVELTYPRSGAAPFKFTTPIYVTPNVEPYSLPAKGTKMEPPKTKAASSGN